MGKIKLEEEIIQRVITKGKSHGLNYYDVEIKSLDVSVLSTEKKTHDIKNLEPKQGDLLIAGPNCTTETQSISKSYTETKAHELAWSLSSTFSYSSSITAKIDTGIDLEGTSGYTFSLTGEVSGRTSNEKSATTSIEVKVPPCTTVKVPINIVETTVNGTYLIKVKAFGTGKAMLEIPWWFDQEVPIVIYEIFDVTVTFEGMTQETVQVSWIMEKAKDCPEESGCKQKKMVKVSLKSIDINSSGMGNDWQFDVKVGAKSSSGSKSAVKGLILEYPYEGSEDSITIPVVVSIIEDDPVYDDHGSGGGDLVIDLNAPSGSGSIKGSAKAVKRDTGSASFSFNFAWTVG